MITCNGILGLSLLVGALRVETGSHPSAPRARRPRSPRWRHWRAPLVLPTFTTSKPGPECSASPAHVCRRRVALPRRAFVFVQTFRHRDSFVRSRTGARERRTRRRRTGQTLSASGSSSSPWSPSSASRRWSQPAIADAVDAIGAPPWAVGVVDRAARADARRARGRAQCAARARSEKRQPRLRVGNGEHRADDSPTIAIASIWLDGRLVLGLGTTQIVLFAITVVVGALTVLPGRATLQESGVYLVLFAAFLVLAVNP